MAPEALLFDLDGTLWDSHPFYGSVLADERDPGGAAVVEELRTGGVIVRIIRERGLARTRFVTLCLEGAARLQLYPGVREGLAELQRWSMPLGVVTNLPGWLVEPILSRIGLARYFAGTAVAARKPQPAGILRVLDVLGVEPDPGVFFVGDSRLDAEAARRAGVSFGWASYGYESVPPEAITVELREFLEVLEL